MNIEKAKILKDTETTTSDRATSEGCAPRNCPSCDGIGVGWVMVNGEPIQFECDWCAGSGELRTPFLAGPRNIDVI